MPRKKKQPEDTRPLVSVTTTAHVDGGGAREALEARAARFYDDLQWITEETHRGQIDRLLGKRKREATRAKK